MNIDQTDLATLRRKLDEAEAELDKERRRCMEMCRINAAQEQQHAKTIGLISERQAKELTVLRNANKAALRVVGELAKSLDEHQMFVVMWAESWRSNPIYGNNQPEIHPTHAGLIQRAKDSQEAYRALTADGVAGVEGKDL